MPAPFGVNIHFTGAPSRDLNGIQSAGFGWVRMDFGWAGIEKTKAAYDFSAYDALLDGLTARHIRPLFILDYGNDLYQRGRRAARRRGRRSRDSRPRRSGITRGRTILWEIWNEPNIGFWKPKPDADEYGPLAVETARAIKEADPDATVLAPGFSSIPLPFIETIFKKGLLQYVDAVSVHPYRGAARTPRPYRRCASSSRGTPPPGGHPAVSSEWGYSTVGVSETTQAQFLARQWLSNLAEGVRLSIWYDWHEDGQSPTDPGGHFGTGRWGLSAQAGVPGGQDADPCARRV